MYRRSSSKQLEFADFYLPFSGRLESENRCVKLASLVPWELAESIYLHSRCEDFGAPVVPARMALAALIIKERLGLTDRETVESIQENPYLQYFAGLEEFTSDRPFHPTLMVEFRKRFGQEGLDRINEALVQEAIGNTDLEIESQEDAPKSNSHQEKPEDSDDDDQSEEDQSQGNVQQDEPSSKGDSFDDDKAPLESRECAELTSQQSMQSVASANRGKLISDATCAPADIRFPTDVSLLNEAREKTDLIIDLLHEPRCGKQPRPRTYRERGRKDFLNFIKKKKPGAKKTRAARRKQLGYLARNLRAIDKLLLDPNALPLRFLERRTYKTLLVCREVFPQQQEMQESKSNRIDDRIVSISQPHVRPIKRGKAGRDTEFGAKLTLSVVDGYAMLDRSSWDNYNEGGGLVDQIERYRSRFGCYPASVHVDKIYRTRANRAFCKEHGIRMSGPPLGRPRKNVSKEEKKLAREDEAIRNEVEGKFGETKRRYSLGRVMAKLSETSLAQISLAFLVSNLERLLRVLFRLYLIEAVFGLAKRLTPKFSPSTPGSCQPIRLAGQQNSRRMQSKFKPQTFSYPTLADLFSKP